MVFSPLKNIKLFFIFFFTPILFAQSMPLDNIYINYIDNKHIFMSQNEKLGYALGVSLGNYINQSLEKQKKIGVELDKKMLLKGVQDAISGQLMFSYEDITLLLKNLEQKLKKATNVQIEKNDKENLLKGEKYIQEFSQKKGVKKTSSGMLYLIDQIGQGNVLTENSKITVHYKGQLIDGTEFDSSYKRGKPITLMLKDVILGWQEGLKYIKKGGKITLVIPPHLGYGKEIINGIPGNSTLIFNIELLDVVDSI